MKPNEKLWLAIESVGLKKQKVAQELGVSPKTVSHFIHGIAQPTQDQKWIPSRLLRVAANELFSDWTEAPLGVETASLSGSGLRRGHCGEEL
ncbi:helix-turn-helix transcriptional regulator [Bdellovibrionota bacterium FG-1]